MSFLLSSFFLTPFLSSSPFDVFLHLYLTISLILTCSLTFPSLFFLSFSFCLVSPFIFVCIVLYIFLFVSLFISIFHLCVSAVLFVSLALLYHSLSLSLASFFFPCVSFSLSLIWSLFSSQHLPCCSSWLRAC